MTDPNINFVTELTQVVGDISVAVASCEYPVPVNTNPEPIVDPFVPLLVNYFSGGSPPRFATAVGWRRRRQRVGLHGRLGDEHHALPEHLQYRTC